MPDITATNTEPGVVAHALRALAEHFDYRGLAAPRMVIVEDDHIRVSVSGHDDIAERWAVTLAAGDGVRCTSITDGCSHWETNGLLPDSGVRVQLTWARLALSAVPA